MTRRQFCKSIAMAAASTALPSYSRNSSGGQSDLPPGFNQYTQDYAGRVPFPLAGGLSLQLASNCPGSVDRATAAPPATPAFFKLAALEVFGMSGLAFFAMPSVEPERHEFLPRSTCKLAQHCTLLHATGRNYP